MRALVIATIIAIGFTATGTHTASAFGSSKSYAYQYCHYYKARALGAHTPDRAELMWARYRACLKENGGR